MSEDRYLEIEKLMKDASVEKVKSYYSQKLISCEELVVYYIKRIENYDIDKLNSIIEINPDVITLAKEFDKGMHQGKLGGIPVVLKANIATADKMATHAGAAALKDYHAQADAFIVSQLRSEGAILLGKTNLSEWAYYMSNDAPSGYSSVGGQTHNPYGKFDVGGSSSGAAAAITCDFALISIGTETAGSIIYPSAQNYVIGIRPTLGTASRTGIIPITTAMDMPGIIAKNIEDIAITLDVISKTDESDKMMESITTNYTTQYSEKLPDPIKAEVVQFHLTNEEEESLQQIINKIKVIERITDKIY